MITKMQQRFLEEFAEGLTADTDATSTALFEYVNRYGLDAERIAELLKLVLRRTRELALADGKKAGALEERNTNPAMRSLGEAVAVAVKARLDAARTTAAKVFDEVAPRGNPYYAFNEAMKAIAD